MEGVIRDDVCASLATGLLFQVLMWGVHVSHMQIDQIFADSIHSVIDLKEMVQAMLSRIDMLRALEVWQGILPLLSRVGSNDLPSKATYVDLGSNTYRQQRP